MSSFTPPVEPVRGRGLSSPSLARFSFIQIENNLNILKIRQNSKANTLYLQIIVKYPNTFYINHNTIKMTRFEIFAHVSIIF